MAESRVKDDNFIVVQGWQLNKLKLKGNELLVYACIYGFSQNEQAFTGSLQYLADWTNSTVRGVQKNLKSLCEKGLLIKREKYVNRVKQCEYITVDINKLSMEQNSIGMEQSSIGMEQSSIGIEQSSIGGIEQSSNNNININNINNNIGYIAIFEKIAKIYTDTCVSLLPLKALTQKRKAAINKILSLYSVEDLEKIFQQAEASDYCKGNNPRGWVAGFDWLINEDNITKLLEGNYDNVVKQPSKRKEPIPSWMNKDQQVYDFENLEKELTGSRGDIKTVSNDSELKERAEKLKKKIAAG